MGTIFYRAHKFNRPHDNAASENGIIIVYIQPTNKYHKTFKNMASKDRDYSNGEITVHWRPEKCTHAAKCVTKLPKVFNLKNRPWIDVTGASTEQITETVNLCPSGALSYTRNS